MPHTVCSLRDIRTQRSLITCMSFSIKMTLPMINLSTGTASVPEFTNEVITWKEINEIFFLTDGSRIVFWAIVGPFVGLAVVMIIGYVLVKKKTIKQCFAMTNVFRKMWTFTYPEKSTELTTSETVTQLGCIWLQHHCKGWKSYS